jgi:hypothetical protein
MSPEGTEGGEAVEEATRRISVRAALAIVAVVAVAAVIWAASALAAGGSSNGDGGSGTRDSALVADAQDHGEARDDDCPSRGGEPRTGSDI